MTRYFDKAKGVEVRAGFDDIAAANVVELDDANPFFSPDLSLLLPFML